MDTNKKSFKNIGTKHIILITDIYFLVLISLIFRRWLSNVSVLLQPGRDGLWLEAGTVVDLLQPLGDARVRQSEVLERGEWVRGEGGGGEQRQ